MVGKLRFEYRMAPMGARNQIPFDLALPAVPQGCAELFLHGTCGSEQLRDRMSINRDRAWVFLRPNVRVKAGPTDGHAEWNIPLAAERGRLLGLALERGVRQHRARRWTSWYLHVKQFCFPLRGKSSRGTPRLRCLEETLHGALRLAALTTNIEFLPSARWMGACVGFYGCLTRPDRRFFLRFEGRVCFPAKRCLCYPNLLASRARSEEDLVIKAWPRYAFLLLQFPERTSVANGVFVCCLTFELRRGRQTATRS